MSKVLDTRDLQKRLEELEEIEEAMKSADQDLEEIKGEEMPEDIDDQEDLESRLEKADTHLKSCQSDFSDIEEELKELREMADEVPEWSHGETLIREDYWEEYVEEMLKDCGELPQNIPHYIVIDWNATAGNIAADYSTLEYQGDTYYYRNC